MYEEKNQSKVKKQQQRIEFSIIKWLNKKLRK